MSTPETLRWWGDQIRKCTSEFYTSHVLAADLNYGADEIEKLQAENAELRKERDFYCNQVIENGGRAQRAIDALNDENAKLRELAKHLRKCTRNNTCAVCEYADDACDFDYDMRELGVEV